MSFPPGQSEHEAVWVFYLTAHFLPESDQQMRNVMKKQADGLNLRITFHHWMVRKAHPSRPSIYLSFLDPFSLPMESAPRC